MPKLFYQFRTRCLGPHMVEDNTLFAEWNMVFLAKGGQGGPGKPGGSGGNGETREGAEREQNVPADNGPEEQDNEINKLTARTSERSHSVLDAWEYEFPADIDPDRVKEARRVVNEYYPELKKLDENIDESVNELLGAMGAPGDIGAHERIWKGIAHVMPEFTQEQLRDSKGFNPANVSPNIRKVMVQNILAVWKKTGKTQPNVNSINAATEKIFGKIKEVAQKEFEMLKTIDQVREVLWDMHDKLQKKSIEERLIKAASRDAGIPLRAGQELQGFGRRLKPGFKEDEPFIEKFMRRWIVKEVYVDKKIMVGSKKKKEEMVLNGVWVALEEKGSGRTHRMSTNRLRDFIGLHEITPAVQRARSLKENVIHLSEMNIDVKAGSILEYDDIKVDPATKRPVPNAQKVKVLSIDDSGVKLSKPVLCRSFYDSPDLDDNEYKSDLTLGEFAKWMNQRKAVPTMRLEPLLEKLGEHYEYMNKQYKRAKNCHAKISLNEGEILHADAPGNPLFEVEYVDELKGIIKLKKSRTFTFTQFLRWVYENDIEPYSAELEAEKMKTYFNAGDKDTNKARDDAKSTINHFQKTGIWRDTLKKLREKGLTGITEPGLDMKEDSSVGVEKQSYSRMGQWLKDTQWLRLDDIFALFKTSWEYYTRYWQRRQKFRYSSVGRNVPFFGNEFERISQNAETEEMQQFKDAMDQWGIPQIEGVMYSTDNRDQLKACFNALAPKGMLRFDDIRLYKAINKHTDINHKVPIPAGDPYKKFGPGSGTCNGIPLEGKNATDFLPAAIDSMWGEGSYVGWKRQSDDSIESCINQTYNKAGELEADPKNSGGIVKELSNLLTKHMNGEWVDQTEYEGLLRFCVEFGKGGGKDKAYYLLMGINAKNADGRTIMGWERVGKFVTKYSNQFPALDFFSVSNRDPKRDFVTGEVFDTPYVRSDFDAITDKWTADARSAGVFKPGDEAEAFLRTQMLTGEAVQIRLEKGIRNAQNMDHDDSPYYIPALKDSEMENVCSATAGTTKKFTIQGYKNAYIGFGMRMKALAKKYEEEKSWEDKGKQGYSALYLQKLIVAFKSYMQYDGIMDNRFKKKKGSSLQRLGASDYQTGCVWDGTRPLRRYKNEMKVVIKEVAEAYGHGDDPKIVDLPFDKNAEETAIDNFGPLFEKMVQEGDRGAKLVEIVKKHEFLFESKVPQTGVEGLKSKAKMYEYDPEAALEGSAVLDTPDENESYIA